jgi:hypothetical protein
MNYFFDGENSYASGKNNLIGELDLSQEELFQKYNLVLDGKKLSMTELEFIIDVIRKLRTTFN